MGVEVVVEVEVGEGARETMHKVKNEGAEEKRLVKCLEELETEVEVGT